MNKEVKKTKENIYIKAEHSTQTHVFYKDNTINNTFIFFVLTDQGKRRFTYRDTVDKSNPRGGEIVHTTQNPRVYVYNSIRKDYTLITTNYIKGRKSTLTPEEYKQIEKSYQTRQKKNTTEPSSPLLTK